MFAVLFIRYTNSWILHEMSSAYTYSFIKTVFMHFAERTSFFLYFCSKIMLNPKLRTWITSAPSRIIVLFYPTLIEIEPRCVNTILGYATMDFRVSTVHSTLIRTLKLNGMCFIIWVTAWTPYVDRVMWNKLISIS